MDHVLQDSTTKSRSEHDVTPEQMRQLFTALEFLQEWFDAAEHPLQLEEQKLKVADSAAPKQPWWRRLRIYAPDDVRTIFVREACSGYVGGRRFAILLEVNTGQPYGLRFFGRGFPLHRDELMTFANKDEVNDLIRQVCEKINALR